MQSLTYTVDGLRWGAHDTKDAMLGRALSYLVLFSTLGIILRWSYGIKLLSTADDEAPKEDDEVEAGTAQPQSDGIESEERHGDNAPLLGTIDENGGAASATEASSTNPTPRKSRFSEGPVTIGRPPVQPLARKAPVRRWTALGNGEDVEDAEYFHRSLSNINELRSRSFRKEISNFRSFPNTPSRTPAASSYASSEGGESSTSDEEGTDDEDDYEGIGRRERTEPSRSARQAKLRRMRKKTASWLKKWIVRPTSNFIRGFQAFMTAPLYAALLSLIVACIPPLQKFMDELLPVRK